MTPADDEIALFEAKAGFVRPEATVAAHLQLAGRQGAELHFSEPVVRWEVLPGGGVRVLTDDGFYTAERLVVCPGAWAPELLADLDVTFSIERQVMYWFEPTGGIEAFRPDRHPIFIHEDTDGTQVYGFPAIDGPGNGAKVAFFRRGRACTPQTIDREVHPEEVAAMADQVAGVIPALPGRFLRAATCMYTNTPDQHFVIATHPRHEQVTVACGFSGHGFKFVPVVGEVVADLVTTGSPDTPSPCSTRGVGPPRRPMPHSR